MLEHQSIHHVLLLSTEYSEVLDNFVRECKKRYEGRELQNQTQDSLPDHQLIEDLVTKYQQEFIKF